MDQSRIFEQVKVRIKCAKAYVGTKEAWNLPREFVTCFRTKTQQEEYVQVQKFFLDLEAALQQVSRINYEPGTEIAALERARSRIEI